MSCRQILSEDFQSSWSYVVVGGGEEEAMVRMSLSPFYSALAVAWHTARGGCPLGAGKASLRPAVPSGRKPRQ